MRRQEIGGGWLRLRAHSKLLPSKLSKQLHLFFDIDEHWAKTSADAGKTPRLKHAAASLVTYMLMIHVVTTHKNGYDNDCNYNATHYQHSIVLTTHHYFFVKCISWNVSRVAHVHEICCKERAFACRCRSVQNRAGACRSAFSAAHKTVIWL